MKIPNPEDLRKKTEEAIRKTKEEKEREVLEQAALVAREKKAQQARAQSILNKLPELMQAAANKGNNYVIAINLMIDSDYAGGGSYNHTKDIAPYEMAGAAAIVAKECSKYKVVGRYNHDGVGIKSWHELVVEW
jgi:hypothetical protein